MGDKQRRPSGGAISEAAVLIQRAVVWHQQGQTRDAETAYRRVLALDPANADALGLLGVLHHDRREHETAVRLLRAAIALEPRASRFWHNLGAALEGAGDIVGAVAAFKTAAGLDDTDVLSWSCAIFNTDLHPYGTPEMRLAARRDFNRRFCARLTAAAPPHTNDPTPGRRLRIGYLSADFFDHSAALAFGPVLEGHDHTAVEVTCYWQQRNKPDAFTARFKGYADRWREVSALSDEQLAAQIRADGIDILVDLSGYSNGHRLLALARKPAPIVMTGWGHVTGLGIDASDYILADAIAAPAEHAHQYHERVLHLPCMLAFDPRPPYPDVAPAPAEKNGYPTFGYFGRASKASEMVWATWAQILHRVPGSRLAFKGRDYADPGLQRRLLELFGSLAIEARRISFLPNTPRGPHLAAYAGIDVALDPFPHGGGVTALEACLMGVPSVALMGDHLNGRIAPSVFATIGYPEWVAFSAQQYIATAVLLAQQPTPHADRQAIRDALLGSIICDPKAYARSVERAYRDAWTGWCASQQATARPSLVLVGA